MLYSKVNSYTLEDCIALWFRRKSEKEKFIDDEFGEWVLLRNSSVSWTLHTIEKAFKKLKMSPIKVYSLYSSVEKGLKDIVDLKAMVVTDRARLRHDLALEISKQAHASVSTVKLVYEGPVAMWFISMTSIPPSRLDEPYYNLLYPYGVESSKIPYTVQDLFSSFLARSKRCEILGLCRKGTTLDIVARCHNIELNERDLWDSVRYFADGVEVERDQQTLRVTIKGFRRIRIIPLVWDDLTDIPEGC